tara:strand:+ start:2672 stop:3241 length:570 start_codon:yes stop_codon:yes gene_type:complete
MTGKLLKNYFDSIIELKEEVWDNFAALGHVKSFPKETILKQSGTPEKYFNFLLEGSGGNLLWYKNNFVCTDISMQMEPLCDYVSFITQNPSSLEVRIFEDSKIFQIQYQNFQKIFLEGNYGEQVTRLALESAYKEKEQQQIDLLTKTAKQRYLDMIKRDCRLETIPLNYMASYLGITPQSLSRIRSQKI